MLRRRYKTYHAVFRVDGKLKEFSLGLKDEAKALKLHDSIHARMKAARLRGHVSELLGERKKCGRLLMVRDVPARYMEVNPSYSPSGLKIFNLFRSWLADDFRNISDIDASTALLYLRRLEHGKTHNNHKVALSKIWTVLRPYTNIEENPWSAVAGRPRDSEHYRPLSDKEIKSLLGSLTDPDWKDAVLLAYHTGLRRKDVFTLRWDSVRDDHISLVPAKTMAKHGKAVSSYRFTPKPRQF